MHYMQTGKAFKMVFLIDQKLATIKFMLGYQITYIRNVTLQLFFMLGMLLFCVVEAQTSNCPICANVTKEINQIKQEEMKIQDLLHQNRQVLEKIGTSDVSKKIKLTSNIFILSTKVETLSNNKIIKNKTFTEMRCTLCPQ